MDLNINNFFTQKNLDEFIYYDNQNYWFGGTDTFSKIYDEILKQDNRLNFIIDKESLESIIRKSYNLLDKIEITDEIQFPFYIDTTKKILIQSNFKPFKPLIQPYEIIRNEVRSFFQKSYFIRLKLLNEVEKGKEYTPLYYLEIFRSQISKSQEKIKINFHGLKDTWINEFDTDGNGIVDIIEGLDDFMILLKKHQNKIIETNREYIQNFIKVSNHLKTKKQNIQDIFLNIKNTKNQDQLNENVGILKNQIHTYELILFHSLNMIISVVEDDLITFYEIYESFDKLNMFNSNWENEVSQRLKNIDEGFKELMYSIDSMERNIVSGLNQLSYVTQQGFSELEQNVTKELQSIDSSIKFNNLLTGISTYQLYKINKQTKRLSP